MIKEYLVPEARCPDCRKLMDAASGVNDGEGAPTPGSIAICFYCHHLAIYEDMKLRNPTDEEVVEIAGHPDVVRAMTMLGKFKQWEEERKNAQARIDHRDSRRIRRKPG